MTRSLFLIPSLTVSTIRPSLCRTGGAVMAGLPAQRVAQFFLPLAGLLRCAGSVPSRQEMHQGGVSRDQARRGAVNHLVIQGEKYAGTVNPGGSEVTGNRMGVFPCAQ